MKTPSVRESNGSSELDPKNGDTPRKTIVLALDASVATLSESTDKHISIALGLTLDQGARFQTLVIEDPDLVKTSALPFTREASIASRDLLKTDDLSMAQTIARSVRLLRKLIHDHARIQKITPSFKSITGKHSRICMELSHADIFVTAPPAHLGPTGQIRLWARPGNLVAQQARFALLYEGGEASRPVFEMAVERARKVGAPLLLLATEETLTKEQEKLSAAYSGLKLRSWHSDASVESLLKLLKAEQIDVLFCNQASPLLSESESFKQLLEKTPATLVFVSGATKAKAVA